MVSFCRALALAMLVPWMAFAADTFSFEPRDGVLVLRNGFVIKGRITPLGESYLVSFDGRGEARLPRTEVEFECGSLDEAYLLKRDSLESDDVKSHLQLADWCMRHSMLARAADQLLTAKLLNPKNPEIGIMERRFETVAALQAANAQTAKEPTSRVNTPETGTALQAPNTLPTSMANAQPAQQIPPFLVQQFTVNVQPILLNRCATHACHGAAGTSQLRLVRPSLGHTATSRLTHRNLQASLSFVNREDPNSSPLLVMARQPHAGFKADYQEKNANQIDLLAAWVRRLGMDFPAAGEEPMTARSTAHEGPTTANAVDQMIALRRRRLNPDGTAFIDQQRAATDSGKRHPLQPTGHAEPISPSAEAVNSEPPATPSADPLDPAEFNRKYHSRP